GEQLFSLSDVAFLKVWVGPADAVNGRHLTAGELLGLSLGESIAVSARPYDPLGPARLVQPAQKYAGPIHPESEWIERDGQQWLETLFVARERTASGQVTPEMEFIQRNSCIEGKYCQLLAATRSSHFLKCEPLLRR